MGKPFAITYSPDNWNAPAGGVATQWTTPYGGLHVQAPENTIGPSYSPALNNVMLRNGEIRSRPQFRQLLPGPDGPNFILGCGSFLSANQVWHTFCMTPRGLWQLKTNAFLEAAAGRNPWQLLGGPPLGTAPISWHAFAGVLYYCNGNHLSAWDGSGAAPISDVAFSGASSPPPAANTIGGNFLAELDNHLILAYVNTATSRFTNRVEWSNNGFNPTLSGIFGANLGTLGATFDSTINVNAGFADLMDVPDVITGLMTIGRVGYIFRQNGITEMTPTGKGIAPFDFNHLWSSQNGIGNVYPFTLAQYGNTGIFISFEQIYQITPGGMQGIGSGARDAILFDLARSTGSPKASIDRGFALGYTYLTYNLRIPVNEGTRTYVFSFEDTHWESWTTSGVWPTGISNECWV